jgi:hypothetical protein
MPTFIAGSSSMSKTIVIMPGGALMAIPLTGSLSSPLGSPTIKTSGSILAVGAGIAGAGINLVAGKDIDIAGSLIGTLGPVTLQASSGTVNIGSFSLSSALSFVASLLAGGDASAHPNDGDLPNTEQNPNPGPDPKLLDKALGAAKHLAGSKSATIPAFIDAPSVKIRAKNANVAVGSEVSVSGWGLPGASFFGSGTAGGGAKHGFGGSHAGLGGFPTESSFAGQYLGMGGRGKATDNPVNPMLGGGGGGGGDSGDSAGKNGGGVLTTAIPGTLTINDLDSPYDAPGGAGTVFTIQRAVKGKPAPPGAS